MMKKIILILVVYMLFIVNVKAECQYSELKELNSLASHITSNYIYNETNGLFDITINNISDKMYLNFNDADYNADNGVLQINNQTSGTELKIMVISTLENSCFSEHLRTITIAIPYINPYYNSGSCLGHEDLTVCNSRFLGYEISYSTFSKLINKADESKEDDKPSTVIIEEEKTFFEKVVLFMKEIWIEVVLVTISSLITISIGNVVLRKIRHKI